MTEGTFYVKDKEWQFTYFGAATYSASIQTVREIMFKSAWDRKLCSLINAIKVYSSLSWSQKRAQMTA